MYVEGSNSKRISDKRKKAHILSRRAYSHKSVTRKLRENASSSGSRRSSSTTLIIFISSHARQWLRLMPHYFRIAAAVIANTVPGNIVQRMTSRGMPASILSCIKRPITDTSLVCSSSAFATAHVLRTTIVTRRQRSCRRILALASSNIIALIDLVVGIRSCSKWIIGQQVILRLSGKVERLWLIRKRHRILC